MLVRLVVLILTLVCATGGCTQEKMSGGTAGAQPNIVVILADDLDNSDLGYRGSDTKTPNIDKLATEGVRLESFYGMPVCTPSRAGLMTGRYPMRYGLQTLVINLSLGIEHYVKLGLATLHQG
jgi:arylsulfatase A-like enzyme